MNPILINPKIDSSASTTEQLGQMKSYLRQFKEEIELILMNIDGDNLSEKFEDNLFEGFSKRMKDSKTMSEITQTAGMIKMAVKDLEGSMASLTLTVNGIESEVYDGQGNSRITQVSNAIVLETTRATTAEGNLSGRIAVLPASVSISAEADGKTATFQLTATKEGGGSIVMSSDTINFTGLVSFTNLQTSGQTVINGDNITTGTIDAQYIEANAISAGSIEVLDNSSNTLFYASRSAKSVSIGGFEIDKNQIKTPSDLVSSGGIALQLPWGTSTYALAIGYTNYYNYGGAPFRVTHTGKVYADDAEIDGDITAENLYAKAGYIGGTSGGFGINTASGYAHSIVGGTNSYMYSHYMECLSIYPHKLSDDGASEKTISWKRASLAVSNNDYVLTGA